jgi:hypothetical protein
MSVYIKISEHAQINNLMVCLKVSEKEIQAKLKTSTRKEIIKMSAEIAEIRVLKNNAKNQ